MTTTKIAELPIMKTYLPKWRVWEGLREVFQNALDEHTQHSNPMEYEFWNGTLTVRNMGATLDGRAFLFGYTSKADDEKTIGQYGEGLKLGVLALARAGKKVTIYVGRDVWRARFVRSKTFNATILAFDIEKDGRPSNGDVTVKIEGITRAELKRARSRIIPLMSNPPTELKGYGSYYGSLLPDPNQRGRLYVKGVWVQTRKDLAFGYNFNNVEVNRDRDLISDWDTGYHAARAINEVLTHPDHKDNKKLMRRVYNLLKGGRSGEKKCKEAEALAGALSRDVKETLAKMFRKAHGKQAVPVTDENGVRQAAFCGASAVVVPRGLAETLAEVEGMAAQNLAREVNATKKYELDELTVEEREKLETACLLIAEARNEDGKPYFEISPRELNIVDFNKDTTLGLFSFGTISIARKILSNSLSDVLRVVVHEVAHYVDKDGARGHVEAQTEILAEIVASLWRKPLN